jgi:hypothetical protein
MANVDTAMSPVAEVQYLKMVYFPRKSTITWMIPISWNIILWPKWLLLTGLCLG